MNHKPLPTPYNWRRYAVDEDGWPLSLPADPGGWPDELQCAIRDTCLCPVQPTPAAAAYCKRCPDRVEPKP